jgi:citrate lyase subunit beta-like protein
VIKHKLPERHSDSLTSPIKLIALIESAKSIMNLNDICNASPYLSGLIFAAEDFALDMSITRTPSLSEFLYARSAIVTASRAHNLASTIDLVCTSYRGEEGLKSLEEECLNGKNLGFNGKQLIHPSQVEICQKVFSPNEKELDWAARIVIADEKAAKQGRGAWTLDGKMIDAPMVGKAKAILGKAEACGIGMDQYKRKWANQEPE